MPTRNVKSRAAESSTQEGPYIQEGLRPVPDPTVLTTAQIFRSIEALKELMFTRIEGMDKALDQAAKAVELAEKETNRQISTLDKVVTEKFNVMHQRFAVEEERFKSIATQFSERDTRTEETARQNKTSVDAALQAAKEAVGEQQKANAAAISKSEAGFTKEIDGIKLLLNQITKAADDKIDDLKTRVNVSENRATGTEGHTKGGSDKTSGLLAVGGLLVGVGGVVLAIMAR